MPTTHETITAAMRQPDPWTCSICGTRHTVASIAYDCCLNTPNNTTNPTPRTGVSPHQPHHPPAS